MRDNGLSIGLLLLDRFQLTSFACLSDALAAAPAQLSVMTPTGQPATTDTGLELAIDAAPLWPEGFDCIVVLGSLRGRLWRWSSTVGRYLRTADRTGVALAGVGNGVEALARLGLLDGRRACVAAAEVAGLAAQFPAVTFVSGRLIEEDGPRLTSLGGTVAADLAGLLVERHLGTQAAARAMAGLGRDGFRAPNVAPPVMPGSLPIRNPRVRKAVDRMVAAMADPRPLTEIAAELLVSRRQLDRLCIEETGQTAKALYLRLRAEEAARMLAENRLGLTDIAWATGFADAPHLSRTLRKVLGRGVAELREGG